MKNLQPLYELQHRPRRRAPSRRPRGRCCDGTSKVNNGEVELTGKLGSPSARRTAHSLAWVTGVEQVDAESLEVD